MRKGYVKLRDARDVCRLVARIINEARAGELEVSKAARLVYMANILLGMLKEARVEEKAAKMQKRFGLL